MSQSHKKYWERCDTKKGSMARKVWDYAKKKQPTFRGLYGRRIYYLASVQYDPINHAWHCRYEASCRYIIKHYTKQQVLEG